jgi:glycosyltransferase involved in cell wall biosynthesis
MTRTALAWLINGKNLVVVSPALALNRFLRWFFAARNPTVVGAREFLRRNQMLRSGGRCLFRAAQWLASLQRRSVRALVVDPRLRAIIDARAVGGAVSVPELEKIQKALHKRRMRVLCTAEGPERRQIEIMLASARARARYFSPRSLPGRGLDTTKFDIVIATPVAGLEDYFAAVRTKLQYPQLFLLVGVEGARSVYSSYQYDGVRFDRDELHIARASSGEPLRVTFLNDVGFQYGAGVALKRQVASFLLKGCEVSVVAWAPGDIIDPTFATGIGQFANWRGIKSLGKIHAEHGLDADKIAMAIANQVKSLRPDVVIVGNVHGAEWPITLLRNLKSLGVCVVAYMHDTYFVTGRCAQPLSCMLYVTGCDERCPTASEYPALPPELIAPAWRERGEIFTGRERVALVGNSNWTRNLAVRRFGSMAATDVVHLGLDHEMFAPISREAARRLLDVPNDKLVITMGAVDVHNQWKGGPLFHELLGALGERDDVNLVLFGLSSEKLKCRKAFGLVRDERVMPLILNAADIYVSTATAESFGQSLLEASACALPVVAFDVGGVGDIIVNNETGILVDRQTLPDLIEAIDRLVENPVERDRMGRNGRRRVEERFTLLKQADAWVDCLKRIC